jgi:hypothetical protein
MEPEKLMEALSKELDETLLAMAKATSLEEKKAYSEIVNNLSQSLGIFLRLARDMMGLDFDDFDDYDD